MILILILDVDDVISKSLILTHSVIEFQSQCIYVYLMIKKYNFLLEEKKSIFQIRLKKEVNGSGLESNSFRTRNHHLLNVLQELKKRSKVDFSFKLFF